MDYLGFGNNVFSLYVEPAPQIKPWKHWQVYSGIFCKMRESVSVACVFILCMNLRRALSLTYNALLFVYYESSYLLTIAGTSVLQSSLAQHVFCGSQKIMLGEIHAMQVYTMTLKNYKNICIKIFLSIKSCYEIFFMQAQKFVLCKFVL